MSVLRSPVAAGALLGLAPRLPYLDNDIHLDASVFFTIGAELLDGGIPYRDVFDHKGPLTYLVFAGWQLAVPDSLITGRLLSFVTFAGSLALLVALVRRHASERAAWVSALVYALAASSQVYGFDPDVEQVALPAVVGAVYLADRRADGGGLATAAGAGASIAAAAMIKPTLGLLGLLVAALVLRRREHRLAGVVALAAAAAAVVVLSLAPYLATGSLRDVEAGLIDYNREYVAAAGDALAAAGPRAWIDWLRDVPGLPFLALGVTGAAAAAWRRPPARLAVIALAWAALMFVAAKLAVRDIRYYYVPLLPAAAIGTGLGVDLVADALRADMSRARLVLYCLVGVPLAVLLLLQPLGARPPPNVDPVRYPLGDRLDADLRALERASLAEVAERVEAVTRPSDRIYVANDAAQIVYWLSDRRPASRWIYPGIVLPAGAYEQVRRDLRRTRPAAIVTFEGLRSDYVMDAVRAGGLTPVAPETPGYRLYARPRR